MSFVTSLEFDPRGYIGTELRAGHEFALFERVRDLSSPLASRRIDRAATRITSPFRNLEQRVARRNAFSDGGLLALDAMSYAFQRRRTNGVDPLTNLFANEINDYLETPANESHAFHILRSCIDEARSTLQSTGELLDSLRLNKNDDADASIFRQGGLASTALELARLYETSGL